MYKVTIVFWLHFLVCLIAHIITPLCIVGTLRWGFVTSQLSFWDMSVMLGALFFGACYVVNHVTNTESFCSLTELEKYYRKNLGLPPCGDNFLPRFYAKCRQLSRGRFFKIPL